LDFTLLDRDIICIRGILEITILACDPLDF
jgi:hypothetical protein